MGEAIKMGGGTSKIVNGILEEYYAESGTIPPNTFVKLNNSVEQPLGDSVNFTIYTDDYYTSVPLAIVKLTDNKFFAVIRTGTYLYGTVVTVNGNTITKGSDVQITTYSGYSDAIEKSVVVISENKVVIFTSPTNETVTAQDKTMYAIFCNISGATITVDIKTIVSPSGRTPDTYNKMSAKKISQNTIVVLYYTIFTSGKGLEFAICTLSNNDDITISSYGTLVNNTESIDADKYPAIYINNTNTFSFVYVTENANKTLMLKRCTFKTGGIQNLSSAIVIESDGADVYVNDVINDLEYNEKWLIVTGYESTEAVYTYFIDPTELTLIQKKKTYEYYGRYGTGLSRMFYMRCIKLNNSEMVTIFGADASYTYLMTEGITRLNDESFISFGTITNDFEIRNDTDAGKNTAIARVNNNTIIVLFHMGKTVYAILLRYNQNISKLSDSKDKIHGVTKTKATISSKGKVWIPNV